MPGTLDFYSREVDYAVKLLDFRNFSTSGTSGHCSGSKSPVGFPDDESAFPGETRLDHTPWALRLQM